MDTLCQPFYSIKEARERVNVDMPVPVPLKLMLTLIRMAEFSVNQILFRSQKPCQLLKENLELLTRYFKIKGQKECQGVVEAESAVACPPSLMCGC